MVRTNPENPARWFRYYQLNIAQRREVSRNPHLHFEERVERNEERTIHPDKGMRLNEMPGERVRNIAVERRWTDYVRDPEPYDPELVREFYAAMVPPVFGEFDVVQLRGMEVRITIDDICNHYGVPRFPLLDATFGIPPIPGVGQDETNSPIIASALRRNGRGDWAPRRNEVKKSELRPEIGVWMRFIKGSLAPSTHTTTVDPYVARLLYCIQHNMPLDVGHIVKLHMIDAAAERATGILPFPCLITKLCRDAGLEIGNTIDPPAPFGRGTYQAQVRAARELDDREMVANEPMNIPSDADDVDADDVNYDPAADDDAAQIPTTIDGVVRHFDRRIDLFQTEVRTSLSGIRQLITRGDGAGPSNPPQERRVRRQQQGGGRRRNRGD